MHTLMVYWKKRDPLQKHMLDKMDACGLKHIEVFAYDEDTPEGEMGYQYSRTALFEGYLTGS